ncbi:hypothetical protein SAMN05216285_0668 [Natrinema salifodinae]|uniref:Uncharacterized protein n=1 Tax=Natrinema salifodinae TaxID=1202768 RepID=A0A1I0M9D6_9EURY|nr:hypothetical protein SAMN05216285_0668 [Natrinema salifodinae]
MDRIAHLNPDQAYRRRLNCEERTRWEFAFRGEGVSP